MTRQWDHVIVGGGSAGCVLAERLSRDPGTRVLAGGLNFGGLVDAGQVGFAGFNFANAANENQRLDMSLRGSPAADAAAALPVRVVIRRSTSATSDGLEARATLTRAAAVSIRSMPLSGCWRPAM